MSKATTERSLARKQNDRRDRRAAARKRSSFLRLYGDVVDELSAAVRRREAEGATHLEIAAKAGLDPATLSRVLSGRAGSNLRTIAAVLNGTDHRMKIEAVPCEDLHLWRIEPSVRKHRVMAPVVDLEPSEGRWVMTSCTKASATKKGKVPKQQPDEDHHQISPVIWARVPTTVREATD